MVFAYLNIGMSMKELGILGGITGIVSAVLLVPAGYYIDKKHPVRVGLTSMIWTLMALPTYAILLLKMSHQAAFISIALITAITLPINVVFWATELPMFMRLLPHTRYGQFSSACAIVRSAMMIVAGLVCGWFLDGLRSYCQHSLHLGGDYYYRLIFVWQIVFVGLALFYRVKLYKMWLKLGGYDDYLPPMFEDDEREFKSSRYGDVEGGGEAQPVRSTSSNDDLP